jgi:outer membrane protein assembly factor BamB
MAASSGVGSPTIGEDGTIYAGTGDGNLYAVNPDGSKKWVFAVPRDPYSFNVDASNAPAIGVDGTIYVAALGYLSALSPAGALEMEVQG